MLLGYSDLFSQFYHLNTQGQKEAPFSTMISWHHGPLALHGKGAQFPAKAGCQAMHIESHSQCLSL